MTKTVTLDKSRDYGTIHPPHEGAYYHQGGFYFDHDGKLVEHLMNDEQRQKLGRSAKPPAPSPGPGKPVETVTTESTGNDGSGDGDTAGSGDGETGPNLTAWLKGEEEIKTRDVQDLIKARYGKVCTKLTDMVEFLVIDQKVVEVSELKPEFAAMFNKGNG